MKLHLEVSSDGAPNKVESACGKLVNLANATEVRVEVNCLECIKHFDEFPDEDDDDERWQR